MLNAIPQTPGNPIQGNSFTRILQQAAIFGEKRHDVLVGNIANIDTPTYKTRDLNVAGFHEALASAIQTRRSPPQGESLAATHPYLETSSSNPTLDDPILAIPRNLTFQDANNRSVEQEMAELSKNLMRQSFLIQVMQSQFQQLEVVLSERL